MEIIAANACDETIRHQLLHELSFRQTRRAMELKKRLETPQLRVAAQNVRMAPIPQQLGGAATLRLTSEQLAAVDAFATGRSLKINAFAGTGKTSTLLAIAKSVQRRGMYLAFNRAIATEAAMKFPANTQCMTVHGLAFRSFHGVYDRRKLAGRVNANAIQAILGIPDLEVGSHLLTGKHLASLAQQSVRQYCYSRSIDIDLEMVALPIWSQHLSGSVKSDLRHRILGHAQDLWNRMKDPGDVVVPLGHDGYLKLWALESPQLAADFILLDEAQDTNPVVLGVLANQQTQIVYVGDRHQQIYEWRGAENALESVTADGEVSLTRSFRFGPGIADLANRLLLKLNETAQIQGTPAIRSTINREKYFNAILCRTNAGIMNALLQPKLAPLRKHVVGGTAELESLLQGVEQLQAGRASSVPDFFGFRNWNHVLQQVRNDEAPELESITQLIERFGIAALRNATQSLEQTERSAQFVLSTVHKAKGREWPVVRISRDFALAAAEMKKDPSREELRITYVALTRAKNSLTVPERMLARIEGRSPVKSDSSSLQLLEMMQRQFRDQTNPNSSWTAAATDLIRRWLGR